MEDNRRRISQSLIDEIEDYKGKDFSEQLLKWKNDSDELSRDDISEIVRSQLTNLRFNSQTGELEMR